MTNQVCEKIFTTNEEVLNKSTSQHTELNRCSTMEPQAVVDRLAEEWIGKIHLLCQQNAFEHAAWGRLAHDALSVKPIQRMRPFWERLTQQFGYHPAFWELWIGEELKAGNDTDALLLLQRTFVKGFVVSTGLALAYAQAMHRLHPKALTDKMQREKVVDAYELVLDLIGLEFSALPVYFDYLNFLRRCEAPGQFAERQKNDTIRRVFQRGIAVPMMHVDRLWKDYQQFEVECGGTAAAPPEKPKEFVNARKAAQELEAIIASLRRELLPLPTRCTALERQQMRAWRRWFQWERSSPLALAVDIEHTSSTSSGSSLSRRLLYASNCALMCLSHHVDAWLNAVLLHLEVKNWRRMR